MELPRSASCHILVPEVRLHFVQLRDELTSKFSDLFLLFYTLSLNATYLKRSLLSSEIEIIDKIYYSVQ